MSRPAKLTIDLAALKFNLERVRAFAPHSSIIAMVKANAYGHGLIHAASALSSAEALGVACLEEALQLRDAGITQPIFLMEGIFQADELTEVAKHQLSLVVHHLPQVEMLEKTNVTTPLTVWLKINTGMNRLGLTLDDFPKVYERLNALSYIRKPMGLMTHFAEADSKDPTATQNQIEIFERITKNYTGPRSLANSAAILKWPSAHVDWVRPGLMLYGASPFLDETGLDYGLQPVMTLSSRIIAINHLKKGDKVGYGGTWVAPHEMTIGVVGAGYGDGYPQFTENGAPVLVNQTICPLVGRVSMDMLTVDLREVPDAKIDDPVVLWGAGLPVETVAKCARTSAYELMTRMTRRPILEVKH